MAAMYHYVRDPAGSDFPGLNALHPSAFRAQLSELIARYEIVGLEAMLEFLAGRYRPARDLCVLTFDDGLADHYRTVLPMLRERRVLGLFFIITAAVEEQRVLPVHKAHFLMAGLGFAEHRRRLLGCLGDERAAVEARLDMAEVRRTYRWDTPEVARFKFFVNFCLEPGVRKAVLDRCFADHFGDEAAFARCLYMTWDEVRELEAAGMAVGGHSHEHRALAELSPAQVGADVGRCAALLRSRLGARSAMPFSYPYGKASSLTDHAALGVRAAGFVCAFTTEPGGNPAGQDLYRLRRTDTKELAHA
ncbi:MAG: polysaccharide deacetylase family protein [Candidatus Rokubacteria bacterium]|nr:polysaccharide deacetylase family protein [Candidatus Rokubacteria bacterium]